MADVNITVSVVIEKDRDSSIRKLAYYLHIPRMSIQHILTKQIRMKQVCSMWVPHLLRAKEMECHHSVSLDNLTQMSQDLDFLSHVIAVVES